MPKVIWIPYNLDIPGNLLSISSHKYHVFTLSSGPIWKIRRFLQSHPTRRDFLQRRKVNESHKIKIWNF